MTEDERNTFERAGAVALRLKTRDSTFFAAKKLETFASSRVLGIATKWAKSPIAAGIDFKL